MSSFSQLPSRILLTGATGFIGGHLLSGLLDDGHTVATLVRSDSKRGDIDPRTAQVLVDDGRKNLRDMVASFEPSIVVHAATYFVGQHRPSDIQPLITSNIEFGVRLLDAAVAANVQEFINFGSSWQHNELGEDKPATLYAATKSAFDNFLNIFSELGMRIVTLKLSDTYGSGDPRGKIIALLFNHGRTGEPLELSPGEQKLSLVHVSDVVNAVRVSMTHLRDNPAGPKSYAVRGAEVLTLKELVAVFEEASGLKVDARWGARPYRDKEVMIPWLGDLLPNWQPQIDLKSGIRQLAS